MMEQSKQAYSTFDTYNVYGFDEESIEWTPEKSIEQLLAYTRPGQEHHTKLTRNDNDGDDDDYDNDATYYNDLSAEERRNPYKVFMTLLDQRYLHLPKSKFVGLKRHNIKDGELYSTNKHREEMRLYSMGNLNPDQSVICQHVIQHGTNKCTLIQAGPGCGKSFTLKTIAFSCKPVVLSIIFKHDLLLAFKYNTRRYTVCKFMQSLWRSQFYDMTNLEKQMSSNMQPFEFMAMMINMFANTSPELEPMLGSMVFLDEYTVIPKPILCYLLSLFEFHKNGVVVCGDRNQLQNIHNSNHTALSSYNLVREFATNEFTLTVNERCSDSQYNRIVEYFSKLSSDNRLSCHALGVIAALFPRKLIDRCEYNDIHLASQHRELAELAHSMVIGNMGPYCVYEPYLVERYLSDDEFRQRCDANAQKLVNQTVVSGFAVKTENINDGSSNSNPSPIKIEPGSSSSVSNIKQEPSSTTAADAADAADNDIPAEGLSRDDIINRLTTTPTYEKYEDMRKEVYRDGKHAIYMLDYSPRVAFFMNGISTVRNEYGGINNVYPKADKFLPYLPLVIGARYYVHKLSEFSMGTLKEIHPDYLVITMDENAETTASRGRMLNDLKNQARMKQEKELAAKSNGSDGSSSSSSATTAADNEQNDDGSGGDGDAERPCNEYVIYRTAETKDVMHEEHRLWLLEMAQCGPDGHRRHLNAKIYSYPIYPANFMTIHKCQGCTIKDKLDIMLSKTTYQGMYVALSRITNRSQISRICIKDHEQVNHLASAIMNFPELDRTDELDIDVVMARMKDHYLFRRYHTNDTSDNNISLLTCSYFLCTSPEQRAYVREALSKYSNYTILKAPADVPPALEQPDDMMISVVKLRKLCIALSHLNHIDRNIWLMEFLFRWSPCNDDICQDFLKSDPIYERYYKSKRFRRTAGGSSSNSSNNDLKTLVDEFVRVCAAEHSPKPRYNRNEQQFSNERYENVLYKFAELQRTPKNNQTVVDYIESVSFWMRRPQEDLHKYRGVTLEIQNDNNVRHCSPFGVRVYKMHKANIPVTLSWLMLELNQMLERYPHRNIYLKFFSSGTLFTKLAERDIDFYNLDNNELWTTQTVRSRQSKKKQVPVDQLISFDLHKHTMRWSSFNHLADNGTDRREYYNKMTLASAVQRILAGSSSSSSGNSNNDTSKLPFSIKSMNNMTNKNAAIAAFEADKTRATIVKRKHETLVKKLNFGKLKKKM